MSAIFGPPAVALDIVEGFEEDGVFDLGMLVGFGAILVLYDLDIDRAGGRGRQRMGEAGACSCDESPR